MLIICIWILTVVFGACIGISIYKKRWSKFPLLSAMFLFAFLCGAGLLVLYYGFPEKTVWFLVLFFFMFGGILLLTGVHSIGAFFQCRTPISAVYLGYRTYSGGHGVSQKTPLFAYTFQGQSFHEQSAHTEPGNYLERKFKIGQTYQIYICEKNPSLFLVRRKIGGGNLLVTGMGICFLLVSLLLGLGIFQL